jgi:hypothetical protein
MGWLSTLGKIGAGVAAPFTGGLSTLAIPAIDALGSLGKVAGGAAKGSADQRMNEGQIALGYGNQALTGARDQYGANLAGSQAQFNADLAGSNAQFGAGMQGAQFGREGQDRERKAAILSSLLGGMQDLKHTPGNPKIAAAMGSSTGGARPSALTGNKEALMALLAQPQIQAPSYTAPQPFQAPTPYQMPTLPGMPEAGGMENALGGIGLGSSILGALGGLFGNEQQQGAAPNTTVGRAAYAPGGFGGSSGITAYRPQSPQMLLPSRRVTGLG